MLLTISLSIGLILVLTIGLLLSGLLFYKKKAKDSGGSPGDTIKLRFRTKYPEIDVHQFRGRFFGLGLILSLLFAIIALSWTVYDYEPSDDWNQLYIEVELIEQIPRTDLPKPKKEIPPAKVVIEEVLELEEEDDLDDVTIEEDDIFEEVELPEPEPAAEVSLPPPPLPEAESEMDEIFSLAEKMPLFGGCEDRACSDQELLSFIFKHLKYPSIARENGVEGRVTVEFVVERDGSVSDIQILRGIGAGCDEAVLKVVNRMSERPMWEPGKQRGVSVRVLYRMPVTFRLQ